MKNRNGSFFFSFLLKCYVEPKIIYISNQIEIWKKYTERNTALELEKRGVGAFQIFILWQTEKNTINYT